MYRILFLLVCILFSTTALQAQTPLLDAIKAGDLPQVQELVETGTDVNALDKNGATPLMWAAYQADLEIVQWLVHYGADPFLKIGAIYLNEEKTAYYGNLTGIAAGEGKLDLLRYLIEKVGIDVDDKEYNPETDQEDGWTAAQWADSKVQAEVMAYLEKSADLNFLSDTLRKANMDITNGATFYKASSYKASMMLFEKHIKTLKETFGATDTTTYATFLYVLGNASEQSGNYEEAEQYYSELLVLWRSVGGGDHPSYAASLNNLSALYKSMGRYNEAEPLFTQAMGIVKAKLGEDHSDYATSLNNLAGLYESMGRYTEAEPLYTQALEIRKAQLGEDHPDYAQSLNNLALLYGSMGQYVESEPLYKQAMEIRKAQLGETHPSYATSLNNLAGLYESMGRYSEAEPLYTQALEIRKTQLGEGHPDYAQSLNNLAEFYRRKGRYAEAEPLYFKSMGIRKTQLGQDHPDYAQSLNNLGLLFKSMGRYAEAEPLYTKAMEIRKAQLGQDHPSYAASLNNLAAMYVDMGRYTEAEALYMESMEIYKIRIGENHPNFALSLNNLAAFYKNMERYAEAERLYRHAVEIRKMQLGENHPEYASSLNNLAGLYESMGRSAEAEPLYAQAMEIFKEQLGDNHSDYSTVLSNQAVLYHNLGRFTQSEQLFVEVLEIRKAHLGENHPDYATSLSNLAALYRSIGRYDKAEPLLFQSQEVYLHQLRTVFPSLSEKEKEQFLKTFNYNFETFHSFSLKRKLDNPAIAAHQYDNALLLKGLLLQSSSQMRERIFASGDTTAIRLYGDWQALKRQWLHESEIPKSEQEQAGIDPEATMAKANTLEKELSLRSEAFAEASDTLRTTWRDVKRQLQPHEAAIEVVRYRWYNKNWTDTVHYAALIVTPKTKEHPHLVVLDNGNELEERGAQSYQSAFATRGASRVPDGNEPIPTDSLYAYLWQPIQAALDSLGGAGKVYLSADGVYHTLNLQTLKNPETGQYLLETLDIERVGSTKDLVKKKKRQVPNNNAILAGYPSYPASPEAVAAALQRYQQGRAAPVLTASLGNSNYGTHQTYRAIDSTRSNISPLPGTLAEVEQLASILDGEGISTQALLEHSASEDVLKKVKSPRILHIATHGFFEPESEQNREGLNREMFMSGLGKETVSDNPYLRCGLYLAGAETTLKNRGNPDFQRPEGQEDGILTAYEATLLDLRGTELVVLSACETGLGVTKNGEGVYGLQRAFQVAGAESVIFSLWKVADQQTQEMMGLFYQNWLQKDMTKRQAFKAAQQTIKEKYNDPYFWGAFVMIGG
ncbi:tetratricopeptide repeat protein [Cyclobacterium plantarum]|uniref:Tetratricopeptide repeat protein n=1 Tax=Cyclobacterium plantarum TaxID=2716263 RepID=A0ABX0HBB7_9BACT|nr:tetratricopeptide repeat protein [Cyclobacterium plantarum]NHE58974.1 tetratricopeptide repeat protein [Cyclobacterium plantarum]